MDFDTIQDIDTQVKHAALDACINENFALVLELAPSPSGVECDTRGLLSEWDILHIPGFAVVFSVAAPKSIHVNKPLTVCHLWESAADELIDSLATRNTRNIVPCLQVVGARVSTASQPFSFLFIPPKYFGSIHILVSIS